MNYSAPYHLALDGTADTESYLDTDTDDFYDDGARLYNAPPIDPYLFDEVLELTDSH